MRFSRLLNGSASSRVALAQAAAALVADDEPEKPAAGGEEQDPPASDPPAEEPQDPPAGDEGEEQDPPAGDEEPAGDPPADPGQTDQNALAAAEARGRLEMADRIDAVFASEDVVGREALAAELLAADMPTDRILATLKKVPKGEAGSAMLKALAASAGTVSLEPGAESQPQSGGADVWAKAHQRLGFSKK